MLETYKDSEALLEHIANLGPTLGAIFSVCDRAFEVYGSASAELVQATSGLAVSIYFAVPVIYRVITARNVAPASLRDAPDEVRPFQPRV